MNKSMRRLIIGLSIVVILFVVILFLGPFYILNEGEQAVILRFGQIIRSDTEAGLHLKMPVVDQVQKYSKKIQRWNGDPRGNPDPGRRIHHRRYHRPVAHRRSGGVLRPSQYRQCGGQQAG
jgi:regulator of protease activity HflC (stomatin/prohibitin superfamily)